MESQQSDYKHFISELNKVQLAINNTLEVSTNILEPVPNNYIEAAVTRLVPIFEKMRNEAEEEFGKEIKQLLENDPDNPVFSIVGLYGTMDFGRLEVAHTNTLAWLLNPYAEHGFTSLLQGLLVHLDQTNHWPQHFELMVGEVTSEHVIKTYDGLGRIDVWAEGTWKSTTSKEKSWLLVIECKIDHHETKDQLIKYENEVRVWEEKNQNGEVFYVFLTPDKHKPEKGKAGWEPLSFEDLFTIFWKQVELLKEKPGYQFLRLYLTGLLKDILEWTLPISKSSPYEALVLFKKIQRRIL